MMVTTAEAIPAGDSVPLEHQRPSSGHADCVCETEASAKKDVISDSSMVDILLDKGKNCPSDDTNSANTNHHWHFVGSTGQYHAPNNGPNKAEIQSEHGIFDTTLVDDEESFDDPTQAAESRMKAKQKFLREHEEQILRARQIALFNDVLNSKGVDSSGPEPDFTASTQLETDLRLGESHSGYHGSVPEIESLTSLMSLINQCVPSPLRSPEAKGSNPKSDAIWGRLPKAANPTTHDSVNKSSAARHRLTSQPAPLSATSTGALSMPFYGSPTTLASYDIHRAFGGAIHRQSSTATEQSILGSPSLQDLFQIDTEIEVDISVSVDLTLKMLLHPAVQLLNRYPSDTITLNIAKHHVCQAIEYAIRRNVDEIMRARTAFYMGLCLLLQAKGDANKYRAMQWFEAATRAKDTYVEGYRAQEFLKELKKTSMADGRFTVPA